MNTALLSANFSFLERFLIRWETRSLGANIDRLIAILPCIIYADKLHQDFLFAHCKKVLEEFLKPSTYSIPRIMDRILLRMQEFHQDEKLYLQDRARVVDILMQDMQLYGVIIDMYSAPQFLHLLKVFQSLLQEKYDKEYMLDPRGRRILSFQEKYIT